MLDCEGPACSAVLFLISLTVLGNPRHVSGEGRWNPQGLGALLGSTAQRQGGEGLEKTEQKVINGHRGFSGIEMELKEQIGGLGEIGGQEVRLTYWMRTVGL